ncbi:hypothetical protein TNCV_1984911 [Trichonephila clavipes]|nr:hypothetical protein TNCV_1984911 [Trichonephila clavipes]
MGNCVYSSAMPDQCGISQLGKRLCLVMNSGLFWGQMITVYGCGGALGQFSSKIMLVRMEQEFLKTSYVIFRLFHGRLAPRFVPCRVRVGSAKTADTIVSLCT